MNEYYHILSSCASDFDIWESIYLHIMPTHQSLLEWVRGTRLRPYLEALSNEDAKIFENEILDKIKKAYPITKNGEILFHFKRLFMVASK